MDLVVEALSCARAGRRIFEQVALHLKPGALAVLKGPNGSGKSTLLRALAGLSPVRGGDAQLGDARLSGDLERYQSRIAYAGHADGVKPTLTVRENLAFWAAAQGGDASRIAPTLDLFALEALADAPAATCSAGQKRRLGLARLMLADRALWLLDEPTVSLDAASTSIFTSQMEAHCAAGGMILAATHIDLKVSASMDIEMSRFSPKRDRGPDVDEGDPFLQGEDWA